MKKKILIVVCYIISICFLSFYMILEINPNVQLLEVGKLILLCGSALFLHTGGYLLSKKLGNKKPLIINLWILLILYVMLFINLTLFDPMWGRNGGFIPNWSKELFDHYIQNSFNVIPFKTIGNYISSFDSLVSTRTLFFNLIGNFICLMPLAFFLPLLFQRQKDWKQFLLTTTLFVIVIEGLQFLTLSGSCDIDDVILNVLGAMTLYQILKIPVLQNLIANIFLQEKNEIDKKSLIKVASLFLLLVLMLYVLCQYRELLYQRNLKKVEDSNHYTIEIIDESSTCAEALEPFYEDQLYIYHFSCIKSDSVYALINNQKYLVKELLNDNPTDYPITIEALSQAGLEFIKENKYEMLEVEEIGTTYQITVENPKILEVVISDWNKKETTISLKAHLIPKKVGATNIKIEFFDDKENLIKANNYQISINENLELLYKIME